MENFEQDLIDVEQKLTDLSRLSLKEKSNVVEEQQRLLEKKQRLINSLYKELTPWQKTYVARHENRPHTADYIKQIFDKFFPLAGDRLFSEDMAILAGFAEIDGQKVMLIGQEKGHDTASRLKHNFGMVKPEGYRKAIRLMKLAEQFNIPVVTLIDTAGAYPGIDAEERGQGRAIAEAIDVSLSLKVPVISCVIGEGGSGGALALGCGNVVLMLENAIYSVISPEGCASILFKSADQAPKIAQMLHLTAQDLLKMNIIDEIIPEPKGGAHRFKEETMDNVKQALAKQLKKWTLFKEVDLIRVRQEKFLAMTRLTDF